MLILLQMPTRKGHSQTPFDRLPDVILKRICDKIYLPDRVCLSLSCVALGTRVARLSYSPCKKVIQFNGNLMNQLGNWMPKGFELCCHCLTFLSPMSFDKTSLRQTQIICINCAAHTMRYDPSISDYEELSCHGCAMVQWAMSNLIEFD